MMLKHMHDIILPLINMNIKIHDASLNGSFIIYSISKPQLYEKIKSISQMTWMEYWFADFIEKIPIPYHDSRVATCDSMSARAIRPAICK
jgi:lipopolysaccharide biosynthesis glycosyltransferase